MEPRTSYTSIGLFFIVALLGMIGLVIGLLGPKLGFQATTSYAVYFPGAVNGLREGSPVRYRGVPVGVVRSIGIDAQNPERVEVILAIRKETPLRQDAIASLEMQGITGVSYVQISGGHRHQPALKAQPGQRYPVITSTASKLDEVMDSAPNVLKNTTELLNAAERFLSPENQKEVSRMFKNLADITEVIARRRADLERILDHGQQAVKQTVDTLKTLEETVKLSQKSLDEFHLLIRENRGSIQNFTGIGLDQLSKLIGDMRTGVLGLNRIVDRMERSPSRFLFGDSEQQGVSSR